MVQGMACQAHLDELVRSNGILAYERLTDLERSLLALQRDISKYRREILNYARAQSLADDPQRVTLGFSV